MVFFYFIPPMPLKQRGKKELKKGFCPPFPLSRRKENDF
jgi:hypothetical protein